MKAQIRIFFTALMFYTRIPVPSWVDHSSEYINKATRYFPLVGWIVGLISFSFYWLFSALFDPSIGIIFSLIAGIWTTGAFHEDGLADAFDGFGGGWTKEKILTIMKDSRVGTFGALALIMLMLLKFLALSQLLNDISNTLIILVCFVSYHALARTTAITLVFTMEYAREDASSKVKPVAKTYNAIEVLLASFFGLLPLFYLSLNNPFILLSILPLLLLVLYTRWYFNKKLGGYTGDCLGAVEQIAECFILLALWKFM